MQRKRNDIALNLDYQKILQKTAESEFNLAQKNKSDADKLVSINTEKLNTMINNEKEIFKKNFEKNNPEVSLDGKVYLELEREHITEFKSSTNEIVDLRSQLKKYEVNAIEENKIFKKASKKKLDKFFEINQIEKELASLDKQITNFNVNKPTNTA